MGMPKKTAKIRINSAKIRQNIKTNPKKFELVRFNTKTKKGQKRP